MTTYQKIMYLGIAAFIFLCVTVFLGVTGLNFTLHKIMGFATLGLAVLHAAVIVYQKVK